MRTALRTNKGLTLVVGLILVLGGLGLVMRGAGATVVVPAGYDTFTTPNDAQTYDNFSTHPIPANFFGPGSQVFAGTVTLKGGPPVNQSQFGSADTVIHRDEAVSVPGDTDLTVTGISFVSAAPITVQYAGGGSETWNVAVSKSTAATSGGSMYFNADGTFNSSLAIYPKYTFTRAGHAPKVFDTGVGGGAAPINLSSTNGTWSQSGSVTVINPGSEQALLASHNVVPAPTPCPPGPQPTATVVPGGPVGPIDRERIGSESTRSVAVTQAAVAVPCAISTDTAQPAP